jgi:hypothetical protein
MEIVSANEIQVAVAAIVVVAVVPLAARISRGRRRP